MLYFSKFKILTIYFIIIFLSFFALINFIGDSKNFFVSKRVNLGLDLQGGSYLLLEVDSTPVVNQKLQQKLINLRKLLKSNNIKYKNLKLVNQSINFSIDDKDIKLFEDFFQNKDNLFNTYYNQFKSYELNYNIENNIVIIKYSKYGLIEIKNSTLEQSLEIVRR